MSYINSDIEQLAEAITLSLNTNAAKALNSGDLISVNTNTSVILLDSLAANADLSNYKTLGISIAVAGLDAADAVVKLQDSMDGLTFTDITGAAITLTANGQFMIRLAGVFTGKYARWFYTKGTNTGYVALTITGIAKN